MSKPTRERDIHSPKYGLPVANDPYKTQVEMMKSEIEILRAANARGQEYSQQLFDENERLGRMVAFPDARREKDLIRYGVELGLVAGITPELMDLSDERMDRLYQGWKASQERKI
jgi:hypothetical protein